MTVDVLAVAAHPDDVEFGCGGTLLLAAGAGLRVVVADLTAGELSTRGDRETRERERRRATELLGLTGRECVGLPDGRVGCEPEHRDAVVAVIRRLQPRAVLAPYTEDRHPDHAAAGRLVRDACFFAGVAKAGPGAPHRPRRVYHYMLHQPFEPVFVVDVSAVWDRRLQVATAYESQIGRRSRRARHGPVRRAVPRRARRPRDVLRGDDRGRTRRALQLPRAARGARSAGARAARPDRTRVPLDDLEVAPARRR